MRISSIFSSSLGGIFMDSVCHRVRPIRNAYSIDIAE